MKKLLFMALAAFAFAACENAPETLAPEQNGELEKSYVAVTLAADDLNTRAEDGKYEEGLAEERAVTKSRPLARRQDPFSAGCYLWRYRPIRQRNSLSNSISSAAERRTARLTSQATLAPYDTKQARRAASCRRERVYRRERICQNGQVCQPKSFQTRGIWKRTLRTIAPDPLRTSN